MILVDANLLLYAKFSDLPQNEVARPWLEEVFNTPGRVGIPWQTTQAFLRLATNSRIFLQALSMEAAWAQVKEWMAHPRSWVPEPTHDHQQILEKLLLTCHATANLIPDAHLAALAIGHGLILCSADSDFARFTTLDWHNPLTSPKTNASGGGDARRS